MKKSYIIFQLFSKNKISSTLSQIPSFAKIIWSYMAGYLIFYQEVIEAATYLTSP